MNSLRQLTRSSGKQCSLRKWEADRKIDPPASVRKIMGAFAPPKLWGFADLHAHPASHLAFGAGPDGTNGPFYGNPSALPVEMASANLAGDLAPCDGHQHSLFGVDFGKGKVDLDPAKEIHRLGIIYGIENNLFHGASGWPDFINWPGGSSLSHQQMHITSIYRAWQGGLRLMVASVTDNQLLSRLWNSGLGLNFPGPIENFDYNSARRQLQFIYNQAMMNSRWMQIVKTPAEARQAISNNKLAVLLGVEMDRLSAEQTIQLKNEFGVSQVIPIHLSNNSFGGVAVYDDMWNTNTWYLSGGKCSSPMDDHQLSLFIKVEDDTDLNYKMGKPSYLMQVTPASIGAVQAILPGIAAFDPLGITLPTISALLPLLPAATGVVLPLPVSDSDFARLNYQAQHGHRNQSGLNKPEILKLMKAGLMIDMAHMSGKSMADAMDLSQQYFNYPFLNSHTGMRPRKGKTSERDIPKNVVQTLTGRGGVIGVGTSGYRDENNKPTGDQLEQWIDDYLEIWNAMGFRGVALGTDANGLSPLIPNSSRAVPYNDNPSSSDGLQRSSLGNRKFDFARDGMAHYGMLADFIVALRQFDRGNDIADYFLFRTAEETIEMWEKVEAAAKQIK